jgi:N-acetylmuramoyl-L-alanine amidase
MARYLLMLFALITFVACTDKYASKLYKTTNSSYRDQAKRYAALLGQYPLKDSAGLNMSPEWVGTTNFTMRKPNFVVIHHTAQTSCEQTLKTFTLPRTQVSAHYVICEDGTVYHMLNDYLRAHHAGLGRWGNNTDLNSSSIGIELDNDGTETFAEPQIQSLYTLLERLKKAHSIPTANFIGHSDLAPTRKNDPNVSFNWKEMSVRGFGLWYGDTTNLVLPPNFSVPQALRIIGYDITNQTAAITVFKRKYLRKDNSKELSEGDKKVLYALMMRFL